MEIRTAESFLKEMECSNILMTNEMTFSEYVENLVQFQEMITKLVMKKEYAEGMRLEEAIYRLESQAREKGLNYDVTVRKGIAALRTVCKELAICMAGKKAENLVGRTLEFISRPKTDIYRNIYVSSNEEETEFDVVVVTDAGIIILEIKNIKDNVTITSEGRLVHSGDECYEKKPLTEKMYIKRKLLKEKLEYLSAEYGYEVPICIESFIVFSTPKNTRIKIDDQSRKEKWCYRTGITSKIDNYIGKVYYSETQMTQLNFMLKQMENNKKRFALSVNFDDIRKDIAEMLALLQIEETILESAIKENIIEETQTQCVVNDLRKIRYMMTGYRKQSEMKKAVTMLAGTIAGVVCAGTVLGLSVLGNRRGRIYNSLFY